MVDTYDDDPTCAVAHGHAPAPEHHDRTMVAVFASPVAEQLLHFAGHTGYRVILMDPDERRAKEAADRSAFGNVMITTDLPDDLDGSADVVVTDHHREELGPVLRDALARQVRWIGVLGNPRHRGPHIAALAELGVPQHDIDRVHRPIGLNIGSRTPPEIALATLAGLLADRNDRPGGFEF
jgi:xanthine dehydrogenase accessory factor